MKQFLLCFVAAVFAVLTAGAAPLTQLDYQGKVLVNDLPFTGTGYFKFSLSNQGNTTNYWSNDGTASGEPAGSNAVTVFNGVFSVVLGASPMTAMSADTFDAGTGLYLRVWFSSTGGGYTELLPAQPLVSGAFAINADQVDGLHASEIISSATFTGQVAGAYNTLTIQAGVISNSLISASAGIQGSKIQGASSTNAGVVQLAAGATGTAVIAQGHPSLNAFSSANGILAGAPNSGFGVVGSNNVVVTSAGTNIVINSPFVPPFDNTIWVALNGTAAGPGTIERPFDSPQAGYNAAAAVYSGRPAAVILAAGNYGTNGLIMGSGNVHVHALTRAEIASLSVTSPPTVLLGKQRVENLVVSGPTAVVPTGGGVKFHNCRLEGGTAVNGPRVEFQDCQLTPAGGLIGTALAIGPAFLVAEIGVYQSSLQNNDPGAPTLLIGGQVQDLEVIGCEIVNDDGVTGMAVLDLTFFPGPFGLHYYGHNYIKGPAPGGGVPAVMDPAVPPGFGPSIGFYHNTVFGDVGAAVGGPPVGHFQFFANNTVYGIINYAGGAVGWFQLGGVVADAANNTEHPAPPYPGVGGLGPLPDIWND